MKNIDRLKHIYNSLYVFALILVVIFLIGCGASSSYTGFSSYFKKTTGTSNLAYGYKDPPVLDTNDPVAISEFEKSAKDYLEGVVNDLEEVNEKADNAAEKIRAVVDAFKSDLEYFHVRYILSLYTSSYPSNFEISGYPEFPDFDSLLYRPPIKPRKPMFLDNEFIIDSYNDDVRDYNRELADFAATVEAYIEDAKHYIQNCKNDHVEIRQKGISLLSYIESLDIDANGNGISVLNRFDAPPKTEKRTTKILRPTAKLKSGAEVNASNRIIIGYKVKRDASGEIIKDENGNFVFFPIYEDEQEK